MNRTRRRWTYALKNKHLAKMDEFVSIMSMVVLIWYLNVVRVCVGFGILCVCDLIEMKHPKASSSSSTMRRMPRFNSIYLLFGSLCSRISYDFSLFCPIPASSIFCLDFSVSRFLFVSLVVRSMSTIHLLGVYVLAKRDCGMSKICLSMSNL